MPPLKRLLIKLLIVMKNDGGILKIKEILKESVKITLKHS